MDTTSVVPAERIERSIFLIRGHKVMLDFDLADIYGVTTKRLNEQVKRNLDRFPEDFMFQLTYQEFAILRSQIATSSWGGKRHIPYAFTEHGTVMLASVLNSPVAVNASVQVVRAFVRLRKLLSSHTELARKLNALENKYDTQFREVFKVIRELMQPDGTSKRRKIGFRRDGGEV